MNTAVKNVSRVLRNSLWGRIRRFAVLNAEARKCRDKCPSLALKAGRNLPVHPEGPAVKAAHQKIAPPAGTRNKMQSSKIKKQNDKSKFKKEFKERLYNFVLKLIGFLDRLPKDNVANRIGDQLLRSGTSILGNYIEGQSASSKKDFTNFFNTSLKSANESKLWFTLLRDSKRVKPEEVSWFLRELEEIANIFASSILTLKGRK